MVRTCVKHLCSGPFDGEIRENEEVLTSTGRLLAGIRHTIQHTIRQACMYISIEFMSFPYSFMLAVYGQSDL